MNKDIIKKFNEEFGEESGVYYGKDENGFPVYLPENALDDIKQFLLKALANQRKEIIDKLKNDGKVDTEWIRKFIKDNYKFDAALEVIAFEIMAQAMSYQLKKFNKKLCSLKTQKKS